jgi:ketosteroid isomerase-like protein
MIRTEVEVDFREHEGKTTMTFVQAGFPSNELRDSMTDGWGTCLDKLDRQLAAQRELRALFDAWFRAAARKDLEGAMSPIATDVVSYEHEAPLAYRGVDAVRAVCKAGFEHMPDGFRWDVPDLEIIVRGDVAVTWGLNRMHGPGVELWSRGTRVFRKVAGGWQMIHQHVSFPYDPSTGAAKLDLRPSVRTT